MKTSQVLKDALELIKPEGAWLGGAGNKYGNAALDSKGRIASSRSPEAACWCAWGAVYKVTKDDEPATKQLEAALGISDDINALFAWNDAPGRTKEEVVALYEKAIAMAEAAEKAAEGASC